MNRVLCVVIIVMLVACGVLSLGLNHYRDNAITYKAQRDKKVSELKLANATITDMQQRQRDCNFAFFSGLISAQFWAGRAQPKSPELGANLL
ncbi:TPA: hypothetical protein ACIFNP_005361, partial [Escherichia coli]